MISIRNQPKKYKKKKSEVQSVVDDQSIGVHDDGHQPRNEIITNEDSASIMTDRKFL